MHDPKKPYGDVHYADPGWQSDGVHRYPLDTPEHVAAAARYFGKAKNRAKYSKEQQAKIDAAIAAAEKRHGIKRKEMSSTEGDAMDLQLLAKELGVAQTDDVLEFARNVREAAEKRVTDSVKASVITAFAKESFGVDVTDVSKAAEQIRSELAKPHAEADAQTTAQLSKLTEDLGKAQADLKEFATTKTRLAELERVNVERGITEQLTAVRNRIELAKADGKATKADEERILTIAMDGDKPVTMSLQFAKDATYDAGWQRNLDRICAKLEEIEARPKRSAVKGETTPRNLARFQDLPSDDEKITEEDLDKLWGAKRKDKAAA